MEIIISNSSNVPLYEQVKEQIKNKIVSNELRLDIFQDFIQNEENSIFVSSHITSDLEHIADYITFINNGEIALSKTRDELLEKYGIVKCNKSDFEKIDKNDYVKFKTI